MLQKFGLVDEEDVYLVDYFGIWLLGEVVCIEVSQCLLPFVLDLVKRDYSAQS